MRPFEDYKESTDEDRSFLLRLLFLDYLETVDSNRRRKKGPQMIMDIIDNDMKEHVRLQNYEACAVIRDLKHMFKWELDNHDNN